MLRASQVLALFSLVLFGMGSANADLIRSLQIDSSRSFVQPHGQFITFHVDGWLQLRQYPPLLPFSVANAYIRPISLHTDSPFDPFEFISSFGEIVADGRAWFYDNPCAFQLNSCFVAGPFFFGGAQGTFDGTTLFLEGSETQFFNNVPHVDYRFTIYATVAELPAAAPAAVGEPGTLLLVLASLVACAWFSRFSAGAKRRARASTRRRYSSST